MSLGQSVMASLGARLKTLNGLTQTFYDGRVSTGLMRFERTTTEIDLTFLDADPAL